MPTDKNALKAGLFIFVAIALVATVLVLIQGSREWFEPTRTVTAAFDLAENLGGLKPGDPVRVGGVDQGRVANVRYVAANEKVKAHTEVDFTLPTKYDLRSDAEVGIEQGLTGAANLNFSDFGHATPWQAGQTLDGRPSALGTFYSIAPELHGLIASIHDKIGPAYDRYDKTLASADSAVIEAKKAATSFSDFLGGSGPDMRSTLANLNKTTNTLNTRLPKSLDKADAFIDDTRQTIIEVRGTFADAKMALESARGTIDDARSILTQNRSRIDHILSSVRETSNNLEGASAEIRRSPWRLLYKPSADEMGNLAVYDATRQFARAAAQLNDAAGAVRDAAADPKVNRKQLDSLMDDLQQTFSKYRQVEQTLWQGVK